MSENKLVYSTDPKLNAECPKCREKLHACTCSKDTSVKNYNFVAILRIEKQGRSGKTVTVIDGLPKVNVFLKDLTKDLKNSCGSGGTYSLDGKEGKIEIQGDKREQIREILLKQGIRSKG